MNSEEKITIGFKEQTGFRISEGDITTGKVVVNGIEITSVEDWEKVTKSLIKLQNNWNELKKWLEEQISINTPNARWKHYNEDGINDYDMVNGNYIKAQSVNVTMKETLNKMQYLEGKNE